MGREFFGVPDSMDVAGQQGEESLQVGNYSQSEVAFRRWRPPENLGQRTGLSRKR
jgi:hypothetical protein